MKKKSRVKKVNPVARALNMVTRPQTFRDRKNNYRRKDKWGKT